MECIFQRRAKHKTGIWVPLLALYLAGCAGFPAAEKPEETVRIPITQEGDMSTVCLALIGRQNAIQNADQTYIHPDGLVFYFVIYPSGENRAYTEENSGSAAAAAPVPAIRKAQNFTIDGKPYWQNLAGAIDSHTSIFTARTFTQNEPGIAAKIGVEQAPDVFIQKTIICGGPLPSSGVVRYPFYFGFEQEVEEFDFLFKLQDVL